MKTYAQKETTYINVHNLKNNKGSLEEISSKEILKGLKHKEPIERKSSLKEPDRSNKNNLEERSIKELLKGLKKKEP